MGTYIFISYGHDDCGARGARVIYEYLKQDDSNLLIWWDRKIKPATEWLLEIDRHLEELISRKPDSCLVYVATPHSTSVERENFCINEIVKAVGAQVRVIPVKLVETSMPLLLCNKQWLDLSDIHIDEANMELQRRMASLRAIIKEGKELPRDGKQEVIMKMLEPCNFSLDLDKHLTNYVPRQWLLDTLKQWIEHFDEKLLLLLGGPGTGKTAFSIWMSYSELSHYVAAWHLCQYNDVRTCSLRNAVKSIAYYLASRIPVYYQMLSIADIDKILSDSNFDAGTLFKVLILEKVQKIHHDRPLVILIDALDEASVNGHNELAEMFSQYINQLPSWLKIVVTSRNDSSITTCLTDCARVVDLDNELSYQNSVDDIRCYVGRTIGQDSPLLHFVVSESRNNFLYAQLLCNSIKENPQFSYGDLPRGINSYYSSYMRRYFRGDTFNFEKHALPLLNIIMTAYEPMDRADVYERLHQTCDWCTGYVEFNNLLKCFGSLIKESDNCLLPFHKSLADWLLDGHNHEFSVYRIDGLHALVNWGMEVVSDEFPDMDDRMVRHFYRYLPRYIIEKGDKVFFELYTNLSFWKRRHEVIGVNSSLSLMIDELSMCKPNVRKRLFHSDDFFDVLNYFNIDLFNTGRYAHLHNLGYSMPLCHGLDDKSRLFAVRYMYINELYQEIADNVGIFEDPYHDRVIEAMLMNELGQTYRKLGLLERSAEFYAQSLDSARKYNGTIDEIIYTLLNLSRIRTLQCRHSEAAQLLQEATAMFREGRWHDSMQGADAEFSAQQLARGVHYVTLETEYFSMCPDETKCYVALQWADAVYGDVMRRDRYYPNHLIGKMFYMLRTGNSDSMADLLDECERSISSKYDRIRLMLVKALWNLHEGMVHEAYDIACTQLTYLNGMDIHMIQRTEFAALVDYITKQDHTSFLNAEFLPWYGHFKDIIEGLVPVSLVAE